MSNNLLRAAGALASRFHAKATAATLRAPTSSTSPHAWPAPARVKLTAHLPKQWPWRDAWLSLFDAVHHPPSVV
ncbi:hypothetical protein ACWD5Q_35390 [Streptomyces sp. NPDC002513]